MIPRMHLFAYGYFIFETEKDFTKSKKCVIIKEIILDVRPGEKI